MMRTTFAKGDTVEALATYQGLVYGRRYLVSDVATDHLGVTIYFLRDPEVPGSRELRIFNGHIILRAVTP
jgi:hypothetical protein